MRTTKEKVNSAAFHAPRLKWSLYRAAEIAASFGHSHIGTEHVMLAMLEDPHALATSAARQYGDVIEMIQFLRHLMASDEYRQTSKEPNTEGAGA